MPNWKKVVTSGSNAHLNQLYVGGHVAVIAPATNKIRFGYDSDVLFHEYGKDIVGNHYFYGHITASGHISASGGINAGGQSTLNQITASAITATDLEINEEVTIGGVLSVTGTDSAHTFAGKIETPAVYTYQIGELPTSGPGIKVLNHISSSGDISSSGTITAAAAVLTTADINGGTIDGITSLTAGGNLDIGSHDFRCRDLHVDGADIIIGAENADGFKITQGGAGNLYIHQADDSDIGFLNIDSGDIELRTENFEDAVYVDNATSRVGIGTESPSSKLQVVGDLKVNSHITASGNISASVGIIAGSVQAMGSFILGHQGAGTYENGTGAKLYLDGGSDTYLTTDGSNNTIKFYANDAEHMKLNTEGLRVANFISASGDIYVGDDIIFQTQYPRIQATYGTANSSIYFGNAGFIGLTSGSTGTTMPFVFDCHNKRMGINLDIPSGEVPLHTLQVEGDISASGLFYASASVKTGLTNVVTYDTATDQFHYTSSAAYLGGGGGGSGIASVAADTTPELGGDLDALDYEIRNVSVISSSMIMPSGSDNTITFQSASADGDAQVNIHGSLLINTGSITDAKGKYYLNYGGGSDVTGSLSSAGHGYGDVVKFGDTTSMTAGACYFLSSSGNWGLASNESASLSSHSSSSLLGVALGAASNVDGVLLKGFVKVAGAKELAVGQKSYMGTGGSFSGSYNPEKGRIIRVLGHCINSSTSVVYFNPDNMWMEVSGS
jgi:hypothetical protein